jgi:hypothetical protein
MVLINRHLGGTPAATVGTRHLGRRARSALISPLAKA